MDSLRKEYKHSTLEFNQLLLDPVDQFTKWFDEVLQNQLPDGNAMVLSTVSDRGRPSSRVVLLKNVENGHFYFFTNYNSRKGQQLALNPNACLLFFWKEFERQVRIEGMIEKISSEESERYFKSRPFFSQIGAIVSPQSQLIQHRDELEMAIKFFEENPDKVQRPEHWGGYKLIPDYFEFWQGRENRLHDRFQYQLKNDIWEINCIAP
ncbi:MAG: pyridoxamine 5'-phosphate oxidase [Saprospiraceae bacterium]|nr:pyridoxamine 5'-phosphate oxidase [Saprospiraceae bacterium]MBK7737820.1 pyridoxamine 5'-phosphate oxidase [Saprospiraceae bacterium]MBK7913593.1 pyridoxamine 5'-phosphate oxidase [Saprospiraceae bacterium]